MFEYKYRGVHTDITAQDVWVLRTSALLPPQPPFGKNSGSGRAPSHHYFNDMHMSQVDSVAQSFSGQSARTMCKRSWGPVPVGLYAFSSPVTMGKIQWAVRYWLIKGTGINTWSYLKTSYSQPVILSTIAHTHMKLNQRTTGPVLLTWVPRIC